VSTLVHLLRESVERSPDREAVTRGDHRLSYAELWDRVVRVAAFLKSQGIKSGARVGILLENSPEYVVCHYGILAAGGTVVALNAAERARRISSTLKHCGASWLFAAGGHRELPAVAADMGRRVEIVAVGPLRASMDRECHDYNDILKNHAGGLEASFPDNAEGLASIIYTSGTTGDPKGVMLSHANLRANVKSIVGYLGLTETDSIVNVLPFHYSYGNSVLHTHLAVGGRLVIHNGMLYPTKVLEVMAAERVTGFSGVPSTFALLLGRARLTDHDLSSLRYMTQAGGPMPPVNARRLQKALPHVKLFVMYGQTEASARLSYLPPDRLGDKPGSCGIPIPGVRMEIRDEKGEPVAKGVTGEIWAKGDNVMQGYWNNPGATAGVLVGGWLKTGDLAHVDDEGYFFIDGRSSDMIKSGAHRISPQEVEEVIAEIDGVREVAVVGVPDELLGQAVKAVIVADDRAAVLQGQPGSAQGP